MRKTPFLIVPKKTGLRQPIHISQLSIVSLFYMIEDRIVEKNVDNIHLIKKKATDLNLIQDKFECVCPIFV